MTPFGCPSVRNGCGPAMRNPLGSFMGMPLALLQVPHGGAMKTPTQFSDFNHVQHRSFPALVVKSAIKTRPEFCCLTWSTPKDEGMPKCCKQEVTRAEPAQSSIMKGSFGMLLPVCVGLSSPEVCRGSRDGWDPVEQSY